QVPDVEDGGGQGEGGAQDDEEQEADDEQGHQRRLLAVGRGVTEAALADAEDRDDRGQHEHARELHDDRDSQCAAADDAAGGDHLGDLVDGAAGPQSVRVGVQSEHLAGEGDQRDHQRAEDDHERDRGDHLLLVGVGDPFDPGDGGGAADREPAGDEQRLPGAHLQQAPHGDRAEQAAAHDAHDDHEHRGAEGEDVGDHQLQAEEDDAQPQQLLGGQRDPGGGGFGQAHHVGQRDPGDDRHDQRAHTGQERVDGHRDEHRAEAEQQAGEVLLHRREAGGSGGGGGWGEGALGHAGSVSAAAA